MAGAIAFENLKIATVQILRDHLAECQEDLKKDLENYLEPIAEEVALYSMSLALPNYPENLNHLKAQLALLAGILAKREQNRAAETLEKIVLAAAKFGGLVLKGLL